MSKVNPNTNVTIMGRLSFPTFTAQEAFERSQRGQYPAKSVADAAPDFQVLVNETNWDIFYKFATETFLPYCVEQNNAPAENGKKAKDWLKPDEAKRLADQLQDLTTQTLNTPAKPVHEKTEGMAPEAVAAIKCIGYKGQDIKVKAQVNSMEELAVPDPNQVSFPIAKPINETTHEMYPGCYVAVTLNLYAYHNGKHPGFSAGATVVYFKAEGERFGGSSEADEDAIFAMD